MKPVKTLTSQKFCNKYTGFMGVNTIDLVHHLMDRYGKIIETDIQENQERLDKSLDTTMPTEKYFEQIDDCIQYVDDGNQPYTAYRIIKNAYNTV